MIARQPTKPKAAALFFQVFVAGVLFLFAALIVGCLAAAVAQAVEPERSALATVRHTAPVVDAGQSVARVNITVRDSRF